MTRLIASLAFFIVASFQANADAVKLSVTPCSQFDVTALEQRRLIVAWLLGYYSSEQEVDVFNDTVINEYQSKIADFCTKNPTFSVANAAEGLMSH